MRLSPGDRLGPYEIVAQIGAGGMGEVYRARDTRLERSVAIKVMPESLATDPALRERFEREARAISALSHPNICTLHDIGTHSGIDYLVMEHLDGEPLADRLARGPLPLAEVLSRGIEIADALEKAHRRGIVHRDLKPGNVMLTRSGAKLLDFGLAKTQASATAAVQSALTEQKPITEQGTILGTYQYMAPEQLEGLPADARTDLFALGAILYEMATGVRAFSGKTRTSLIAAIVSSEPRAISDIQPLTPPALERLVRNLLAKDPDERWQSAHDVRLELEAIAASQAAEPPPASRRSMDAGWIAAGLVAIAALGWFAWSAREDDPTGRQKYQFELTPPAGTRFNPLDGPAVISPDGSQIVVRIGGREGRQQLHLRRLDETTFHPLTGTEGAFDQFWSPDSRQVGFFADGKLKRLELSTSAVSTVCAVTDSRGASWSADGTILLPLSSLGPIYRVPAAGGQPVAVTKLDVSRKETAHWRPWFLPDGKRFLFIALSENSDNNGVYLGSIESPDVRRVLNVPTNAMYAEPGYLLYVNDTNLYAQPFDADAGVTTGEGTLIARGIDYGSQYASGGFSVARNGTLIYHRYAVAPGTPMVRMTIDGDDETPLPIEGVNIDLSRDGTRIAMMRIENQQRNTDIWTYDLRRGVSSRITFEPNEEGGPVWSSDGRFIVYTASSAAGVSVMRRPSGGGGKPEVLLSTGADWIEIVDWSSDGQTLLAEMVRSGTTRLDVVTVDLKTRSITPFAATPFMESSARFSPAGRWVAYRSDESGQSEIYVQPFPPDGSKWQVSSGGGEAPRWAADGRLFYVSNDAALMSVEISTRSGFEPGAPKRHRSVGSEDIVITPDGKEVIVSQRGSGETQPIVVTTDWRP